MILTLTLPRINDELTSTSIRKIHAAQGAHVPVGGKLLELTLTLGGTHAHDCPPASHFLLAARDAVWVRRWDVAPRDEPTIGDSLAVFSTEPDEPLDAPPARELRLTIAGIVPDSDFWDEWA